MRTHRRWPILGLALAGLLALGSVAGFASVFVKVDIPTLRTMSESVVHATVVDVRSAWNPDHTYIFTHVTLDVQGRLHGTSTDRIVVRVPGGQVGDFHAEMLGAPTFEPGEEVVAFIGRWDDGVPMIAGYQQGVSRVERDAVGNRILRGGLADGLPLIELGRTLARSGR